MSRSLSILLLALAVQCVLVAVVYWPEKDRTSLATEQALLPFDPGLIQELQIGDAYDNETVLRKTGEHWRLPELEDLPADGEKIEQLFAALTSGGQEWPVARTAAARQRFKVASYHYQRSLTFISTDELLGTVYLGTSPGFRKVHARNEVQDQIYSIALNLFDAHAISSAWLDRKLLQIRTPMSITADGYALSRAGGGWVSGMGNKPDERELEALLSILRNLQVDGVAAEEMQRDLAETEADLVLQVQSLSGERTLELFTVGQGHYIHSSEYTLFFKLSAYDYDRLGGIDAILLEGELD